MVTILWFSSWQLQECVILLLLFWSKNTGGYRDFYNISIVLKGPLGAVPGRQVDSEALLSRQDTVVVRVKLVTFNLFQFLNTVHFNSILFSRMVMQDSERYFYLAGEW